jgi:hypothetical protein
MLAGNAKVADTIPRCAAIAAKPDIGCRITLASPLRLGVFA